MRVARAALDSHTAGQEDSAVLPDAEKKAQSVLREVRGRRDICEVLLRAREGRVGLQQTPTCADRRVDGGGRKRAGPQGRHEGSQLHRGCCRAAG